MAHIVTLTDEAREALAMTLDVAAAERAQVHFWIDPLDRGLKVKVGFGTWSPAFGSFKEQA